MKKTLSIILVISMLLGALSITAAATSILEGEKLAEHLGQDKYGVTIKVPGGDGVQKHDEVILMVDGSYSGDKEWPAMRDAINAIGSAILNGRGNTRLTLMAFGMGDNIVLEHVTDAADLSATLGELPGYLLRGVSSTNCEAGFTGVAEYIENHADDLNDAIVIYITDGGINTDETPRQFYDWQSYAKNINNVINYAVMGVPGTDLTNASHEEKINFVNDLWKAVFEHSNMDINGEYPISEAERAFLQYDEDNGTNASYSFLIAMKNSKFDKYPNVWSRTYNSVFELVKVEEVSDLYLVRYQNDNRATWMPDAAAASETDNIHYVKSDSISTLTEALKGTIADLSKTPYNDVTVVDYMSKWVNLLPETITVVDSNGHTVAEFDPANSTKDANGNYTHYAFKWTGEALCANKAPIVLDLIPESEYAAGGRDVIGNSSGVIYRITWNLKDGPLYRNDAYELKYDVTVDYDEPGIKYDTDLPANGNTYIEYKDENGEDQDTPISVPDIIVDKINSIYGTLSGIKYLNGTPKSGFTFALEYNGEVIETAQSDPDGIFRFSQPEFEEAGEYVYKIYETDLTNSRIIYDRSVYEVTYTVTRTADQFDSEFSVTKNGDKHNGAIAFYNETVSPITVFISGTKELVGGELADGEFEFILKDKTSGEIYSATNDANGDFSFTLELEDGYYEFVVYEANSGREDIVYDTVEYNVTVIVERSENGHYNASVGYKGFERIVFVNEVVVEETTEPEVTEPEVTEPEVTEPEITEPEITEPEVTEPEVTEPEVTEEEVIITEESTPLDPTPETTEPEVEITDPEIPLDPAPDTGDNYTILAIVSAIASLSLAIVYIKRRQTTEE